MDNSQNVLLAWPNKIEDALSLFDGSYTERLPLSNAANRVFARRARTTDTDPASTLFRATFGEGRPINVVAIASHNFTTNARIRVRLYAETSFTTLIYDTGLFFAWPDIFIQDELEWEYNNFWEGTITEQERRDYTPLAVAIIPEMLFPLGILVEIFDESNPDGYVEFGRIFVAESFQPEKNMVYGAQIGYDINTEIETTLDNTEYYDRKTPRRTTSFTLDALTEQEAISRLYIMQRTQGIDREIFFTYKNLNDKFMYPRTFIGRLQQPDPISQPYIDRFSTTFNLIEVL